MEPDQLKALVAGVFSRSATMYERTGVTSSSRSARAW